MRRGWWLAVVFMGLLVVIFGVAYYFLVKESREVQEKALNPKYLEEEFEKDFEKLNNELQKKP